MSGFNLNSLQETVFDQIIDNRQFNLSQVMDNCHRKANY